MIIAFYYQAKTLINFQDSNHRSLIQRQLTLLIELTKACYIEKNL